MNKTTISWTDFSSSPIKYRDSSGKSVWGCVKCSAGCANCYSEALGHRYGRGGPFTAETMKTLTPYLDEKELHHLLHSKKIAGKRVFVEDMSDMFGEWVPQWMIHEIFHIFVQRQDVTFQCLTKRPEIAASIEWQCAKYKESYRKLPNLWLGTSVENQEMADLRGPALSNCPAAFRFWSIEPILGPVNIPAFSLAPNWVIVGGESGPHARPCEVEWVRSIVEQCESAGIAVWVKQDSGSKPGQQGRIPDNLWRHEMPEATK
jgi:protein gp37